MTEANLNPYLGDIIELGHSPESLSTSRAIGRRILQEENSMYVYLAGRVGYAVPYTPPVLLEAMGDAYGEAVRKWMKAPSPLSIIFSDRAKVLEEISSGDWNHAFEKDVTTDDTNPEAANKHESSAINTMRQMIMVGAENTPPDLFGRPETIFPGVTTMLTCALKNARASGKPIADYYNNDEEYENLVRNTFSREAYIKAWLSACDRKKDLRLLQSRIRAELQMHSLPSSGRRLTSQELSTQYAQVIAKQLFDEKALAENEKWLNIYHEGVLTFGTSQVNRFWPPKKQEVSPGPFIY